MRTKKSILDNPMFERENHKQITWTLVVKGKYPHSRVTACCGKRCRIDDIVITFPAWVNGTLRGTAIVHKRCLMKVLQSVPDEADVVKLQWLNIREKHARKSSTLTE